MCHSDNQKSSLIGNCPGTWGIASKKPPHAKQNKKDYQALSSLSSSTTPSPWRSRDAWGA